eukprot:CAMPEP_0194270878 /NCGR_PEP_ID=MMETSP0169-20130528/4786_1 /TAXON_ID=218684 /ORGANISM="Corethron pennatum, Strain L29A3" /LENGTH=370 /DNA_ID=CAMNT_0039013081 /DNA_START=485 /DNA_END=1597 /DNA_ORIENTATION=+
MNGARKEKEPTAAEQDKKLKESVTAIKNSMIEMSSIEMQQKAQGIVDNQTPPLASLDSMSSNSMISMASVDPASIALAVASSSHCDLINNKRPASAPDLSRRARPRMSPDSKGETKETDNFIKPPALSIAVKPELKPLPPKSAAPVTPSGQKTKTSGKGSSGKAIGQAKRWQLKYRDLLNFRSLHGTCSVPSVYPEDPQLASWVYRQRTQYRYKKEGRKSNMSEERIKLLNSVNFEWCYSEMNKQIPPPLGAQLGQPQRLSHLVPPQVPSHLQVTSHHVPLQGLPLQGMPQQGMPQQGVPQQGMPQQGAPQQAAPQQVPPHQVPNQQVLSHQVPSHQAPPHQVPSHQVPPQQVPPHHQVPPQQVPSHQGP